MHIKREGVGVREKERKKERKRESEGERRNGI
jgi:hypothetical protein